jgi:sugar lactone lactonase YvrE
MRLISRLTRIGGVLLAGIVVYLLTWPVPIDPVAWEAPLDAGLVDPFEVNDRLAPARRPDLGSHEGPEDIALGPDGRLYTGTADGLILRFDTAGSAEMFADTGGRPLGLEFDGAGNLLVANAYLGLQRIGQDGRVEVLANEYNGIKIDYANDVAVALDGTIFFSDSSTKFGAMKSGGSYEASLLDIMEHGGHGRVFRHDPLSGETTVLVDSLNYANGVAISADQSQLLINETGGYRVLRYRLTGPNAGTVEVVIDNLPGFPDNINNGLNERFWIGLVAPRNRLLDRMSGSPLLRKVVQRLPAALRPKAVPSSHVIAINADGEVLIDLQDTAASLPALTGVLETRDALWLSSLFGHHVGRLDKSDLAPPW